MAKKILTYLIIIGVAVSLISVIIQKGNLIVRTGNAQISQSSATQAYSDNALFGSFLAGVMMPNNIRFKESLTDKIEDISTVLLLPIFFAFTGLRTQIGLLNTGHLWALCGIIILIAIIGKFGGSALSARIVGRSWKESLSIGALMNTRGLMELVVLNIGYDLKILGPEVFAIMVLMALGTTLMTGPLLDMINHLFKKQIA